MKLLIAILLCTSLAFGLRKPVAEIKVSIEATESDALRLLEKLNQEGKGCHWHFTDVRQGFDYRIVFAMEGPSRKWGWGNTDTARASAYDAKGTEIFSFTRSKRLHTAAIDSAADEIVERLRSWRKHQAKEKLPVP